MAISEADIRDKADTGSGGESSPAPVRSFERHSLPNGLTVITKEMHSAPVVSFWVWYRVGARNEHVGITGISHWVEHMMFKGTPTMGKGQMDIMVAENGGTFNAFPLFRRRENFVPQDRT